MKNHEAKRHSRLVGKIVRPYFLVLTVILSLAMAILYYAVAERFASEAEAARYQLAEKTAEQADAYIDELNLLAEQVRRQGQITGMFYSLQEESDAGNRFDKDILSSIHLTSALNSLIADKSGNYNIAVYNGTGDFISSQNFLVDKNRFSEAIVNSDYAYQLRRLSDSGDLLVDPPAKNPWTNGSKQYITVKKALKNDYSDTVCGIIAVRGNAERLRDLLTVENDAITMILCDRMSGRVLYPAAAEAFDREYIAAPLKNTNWEIRLKGAPALDGGVTVRLVLVFIGLYFVLLSSLFLITDRIGKSVTEPIALLAKRMREISAPGDAPSSIGDGVIDEVKELEDSFEHMLKRLDRSAKQEKRAYSLALQAQMNPHFLYNMLNVISASGLEGGCESVSDMCVRLSAMLRYVADYQTVTVPLSEEIGHTENYLSLMHARYEEYFTYRITADEALLDMPVPKLIIQPLSENCFMHGFKKKEPPWHIDIVLTGSPAAWEMTVRDNGVGIDGAKIEALKTAIEAALSDTVMGDLGGIGIVNTIVRLSLMPQRRVSYRLYNDGGMVLYLRSESEG